jgi:hypothetical protein
MWCADMSCRDACREGLSQLYRCQSRCLEPLPVYKRFAGMGTFWRLGIVKPNECPTLAP